MKHALSRGSLLKDAETSYFSWVEEIDYLFDLALFYDERYPGDGSLSDTIITRELKATIDNLSSLVGSGAEVLKSWKSGRQQVLSVAGIEIGILNELMANCNALVYFLVSQSIDVDGTCLAKMHTAFKTLVRCNRLLT